MPTPVNAARQCLTEEAARALDEAVSVARRRSHAQTTSLHAVSALLSLPSSTLRDACARARSSAHPSRLQFRALELCLGVSLDRLPSSKTVDDPPISNSLMAAIKRSQANQRRHPESYHLHQLHSNNGSGCSQTASLLKVELKYFILSILDDPIVSRVFNDAGFRSCDIKIAIIHPPVTQVSSRFSRARCPPIFLCNLTDSVSGRAGFNFPFTSQEHGVDDNCRRISEVMVRKSGKNPLLIGVFAVEALRSFTDSLARGKSSFLAKDLAGMTVVSIEKEVNELAVGGNEGKLGLKLEEMEVVLKKCNESLGGAIALNFGDLKDWVLDGVSSAFINSLVLKLTGLMEDYRRKLWLIGAVASFEIYAKFSDKFPNIEKDWDLNLLPITTSSKNSFDGANSKSSLMGSFVPFGGFFPTPSDLRSPLSGRCNLCNEKYEQEVASILKLGSTVSVADQYSHNLPSWLQMAAADIKKGVDVEKTKDGETMLNAKVMALQKKWNDICQRLHHAPIHRLDVTPAVSPVRIVDRSLCATDKRQSRVEEQSIHESPFPDRSPSMQMHLQKIFTPKSSIPILRTSEAEKINIQPKLLPGDSSQTQKTDKDIPRFTHHPQQSLVSSVQTPSLFAPPITRDLELGAIYASTCQESNIRNSLDNSKKTLHHFSGSICTEFDANSEDTSVKFTQSSSCFGLAVRQQFDQEDYKSIRKVLAEKVSWQDEAVNAVSQVVSQLRSRGGSLSGISCKGNIWLTFLGPDRVGKRRIASALAEVLFGGKDNLVFVDLCLQDKASKSNLIFESHELNGYDLKFRGKTVSDRIAEELRKKPHSVIFLENVHKADVFVQQSLEQAIRTGKFPDSTGREISISSSVIITASPITKDDTSVLSENKSMKFSEERILGAKNWQMQILVSPVSDDVSRSSDTEMRVAAEPSTSSSPVNKRKVAGNGDSSELGKTGTQERVHKASRCCLDLNLPVEETEDNIFLGGSDSESLSENSEVWLEDHFSQVHMKVHFKAFDFDGVANKIVKEVSSQFHRTVGSDVVFDIDEEATVQILAAAWLSDRQGAVKDWLEKVLCRSFVEVQQKYHLTSKSVVKLVSCEGFVVNEQVPGLCLPAKINVN